MLGVRDGDANAASAASTTCRAAGRRLAQRWEEMAGLDKGIVRFLCCTMPIRAHVSIEKKYLSVKECLAYVVARTHSSLQNAV